MEQTIKNVNELRSAVTLLSARVNNMCNATTTEEVAVEFSEAKDLLVAIFKFNVQRMIKND